MKKIFVLLAASMAIASCGNKSEVKAGEEMAKDEKKEV